MCGMVRHFNKKGLFYIVKNKEDIQDLIDRDEIHNIRRKIVT